MFRRKVPNGFRVFDDPDFLIHLGLQRRPVGVSILRAPPKRLYANISALHPHRRTLSVWPSKSLVVGEPKCTWVDEPALFCNQVGASKRVDGCE